MTDTQADTQANRLKPNNRVRIGDVWYRIAYHLPSPLFDESGRAVDLVLDRLGMPEYGSSREVAEIADPTPVSRLGDCG
jgi:hypothetical protein